MSEHAGEAFLIAQGERAMSALVELLRDKPHLTKLVQDDLLDIYLAGLAAGLAVARAVDCG